MADAESMLNEDGFSADTVDTPREGVEQHGKQECLKGAINKGKVYFLGGKQKWTQERVVCLFNLSNVAMITYKV